MENFSQALLLMVVGMCTVICVLLVIIAFGNLLIRFVNKFVPAEEVKPQATSQQTSAMVVSPTVEKAIAKAVDALTNGKGRVEKVERI